MLARQLPLVLAHTHHRRATNHHLLHQLSPWQRGRRTWQSSPFFGADDIVVATMKGPYTPMCMPLIRCEVLHQIQLQSHHALLQHWC